MTILRIFLMLLYIPITFAVIGYLDFGVFSPMILPEDLCYYESKEPPIWVEYFFLDSTGHLEPIFNPFHFITYFIFCFFLAFYLFAKTDKCLSKFQKNK